MAKLPTKQNQQMRVMLLFAGIIMLFLLAHLMVKPEKESSELKFSDFIAAVKLPAEDVNKIVEVTFQENVITGKRKDQSTFKTYGPSDTELRKLLEQNNVVTNFIPPEEASFWKSALIQLIPIIFLVVIFLFFMRQLQVGGGKALSFGKSRAKLMSENQTKVTFADVAGVEESKDELQEIVEFLREPKKFTRLGGRIPKGVLLVGAPGTGKTLLARAIAGEAGVPFFSISGSDFVEMFVGVGASRVRDLFEQAKKQAPCLVFIDEIDAVGRHRGAGLGGGHDEREQTLNQLLVEMDGFETNEGVIIIAATNRPDVLDPALLRPGRFDRRVVVPKPDVKGREAILKVHTRKTPVSNDVILSTIAQGTPGFVGADLENLVNEAALIAARNNCQEVTMLHFELAKDKVLMGPERRSLIMNDEEKRNTAYHEAGHALVGLKLPGIDPVHKVTIIPRGQALGVTMLLPIEDRMTIAKEYAEGMICYALGGRAAEEIVFSRQTTGAGDDLEKSTEIARKMVCNWGMSESLGPLALGRKNDEVFLGREFHQQRNYSEKVAEEIDKEVHRIVTTAYKKAVTILSENKEQLDIIAEALLIRETLTRVELASINEGKQIISEEERQAYLNGKRASRENPPNETKEKVTDDSDQKKFVPQTHTFGPLPQGT